MASTNQNDANHFETQASRAFMKPCLTIREMVADPDFWICLAMLHCPETVEWRYGKPAGNRDASRRRLTLVAVFDGPAACDRFKAPVLSD